MKHIWLLLTTTFITILACNSGGDADVPQVKGKFVNSFGEKVFLDELTPEGINTIDSAITNENGEFEFATHINKVGFYKVGVAGNNFATLIIDSNQQITITADANNIAQTYNAEGSPDTKLFIAINNASQKHYRKLDSLTRVFQSYVNSMSNQQEKIDSMSNAIEQVYNAEGEKHEQFLVSLIKNNSSSIATIAGIQQLDENKYFETYELLSESLAKKYPQSPYAKYFINDVEQKRKLRIGSIAPDINLNSPTGETITLSSLRGKIVLLDFWASWCAPCRAESPTLVKAYERFSKKGFEIYSVSLDKEKEPWLKAIEKDKLSWIHVSDLKFWGSEAAKQYGVRSIPYNCLIDKDGKIIAKNLHGEDLENKICELHSELCM